MRSAWVIFGVVVIAAATATVVAQDHAYVGADKCKMCHKVQYTSWEETTHAKALEHAKASSDPAYEASCLSCHATNSDEALPGVQCESCHGPGSDYRKMSIMKDREQAVANGLILPTQETCDRCHVDDGHSMTVSYDEQLDNPAAIHEFKNPPGK